MIQGGHWDHGDQGAEDGEGVHHIHHIAMLLFFVLNCSLYIYPMMWLVSPWDIVILPIRVECQVYNFSLFDITR